MISIHAPPRGATLPDGASTTSFVAFQFTPLREGRQSSIINGLQGDYFNSRPSARGDASRQCRASGSTTYFNSRPSARGDCSRSARRVRPFYFNSRPSARGDGKGVAAIVLPNYFNSRPSARGDNRAERRKAARDIFQFTPLREGRLTMTTKPRNRVLFQFTPLREGRQNRAVRRSMRVVFQFTPLREGRRFHAHSKNTSLAFQFTPLREGRRLRNQRLTVPPRISIHAPPRGATMPNPSPTPRQHFNSRPSARGDLMARVFEPDGVFQFTPLREGRPSASKIPLALILFQFTPLREGRQIPSMNATRRGFLFQFTPLREGRRAKGEALQKPINISIHAPPRGATANQQTALMQQLISIHAPPRGATVTIPSPNAARKFQFTPLREGRQQKICNFCKSFVQPLQISMA